MSLQNELQLNYDEFDFQFEEDDLPNSPNPQNHQQQFSSKDSSDDFLDVQYPALTAQDFEHQTTEMFDLKLENDYERGPKGRLSKKSSAKNYKTFRCECGKRFRKEYKFNLHKQKQHSSLSNGNSYEKARAMEMSSQGSSLNPGCLPNPQKKRKKRMTAEMKKRLQQTEYDQFGNKVYITKRIYFCGRCYLHFKFNEELALHLKQNHEDIPDGTVYGLKQETLLKFFKLHQFIRKREESQYKYRCGCGKIYICSSSLRCHISVKHNNIAPEGTIGALPHWSKSKYRK